MNNTKDLIEKLNSFYDKFCSGYSSELFQVSMICKEAAKTITELQCIIDERNSEGYVDALVTCQNKCKVLEHTLEEIQTILNRK